METVNGVFTVNQEGYWQETRDIQLYKMIEAYGGPIIQIDDEDTVNGDGTFSVKFTASYPTDDGFDFDMYFTGVCAAANQEGILLTYTILGRGQDA